MKNKALSFLCLIFLLAACAGTKTSKMTSQETLRVAFYNVENLFDTLDDTSINDEDFLPGSKSQWTAKRYQDKINKLGKVIKNLGAHGNGPDVLGLCEVENRRVLEDLVASDSLKAFNYQIAHFDSPDERGIDVALIYKKGVLNNLAIQTFRINFPDEPDFLTRDILMASAKTSSGEAIHFYVNHFPSRRGGETESEKYRMFVASVLRKSVDSLLLTDSQSKILIMGDFNDMPNNKSIKETLKSVGSVDSLSTGFLFNPFAPMFYAGQGTYNYRNQWNMLDQMILSTGLLDAGRLRYQSNSSSILAEPWMKQKGGNYDGYPDRTYAGARYLGGYSDHFPIYLDLVVTK